MNLRVIVEYDSETKNYGSWCPELPGCTSFGDTEKEALNNIKEAIELYPEPDDQELNNEARIYELAI